MVAEGHGARLSAHRLAELGRSIHRRLRRTWAASAAHRFPAGRSRQIAAGPAGICNLPRCRWNTGSGMALRSEESGPHQEASGGTSSASRRTPCGSTRWRPVPGPGELLVRVAATTLNFNDVDGVRGRYRTVRATPPVHPRHGGARLVEGAGDGAEGWLGKRVVAVPTAPSVDCE